MRVNIYAEEMTDRVEIITKNIDGNEFTALRFYLELPTTVKYDGKLRTVRPLTPGEDPTDAAQVQGPFMHRPGDDDSAAVTFWGKQDLRVLLRKALRMLDDHYGQRPLSRVDREGGWNAARMADGAPEPAADSADAARYRRLRVLGVAPAYTTHLEKGEVLRFTNLDAFVDEDIKRTSRGEASRGDH